LNGNDDLQAESKLRGEMAMREPSMLRRLPLGVLIAVSVVTGPPAMETKRPAPHDACNVWREYMGKLIDQHRIAADIDDKALSEIVLQFISARDACSPGQYEMGMQMYEAISLGQARAMLK
jgi:hypothetical protein